MVISKDAGLLSVTLACMCPSISLTVYAESLNMTEESI